MKKLIALCSIVSLSFLPIVSCGKSDRDDGFALDKVANPSAVVSEKNYTKWSKLWDHASWNVAVEVAQSPDVLKASFSRSIISRLNEPLKLLENQKAFEYLQSRLQLQFTSLVNVRKLETSAAGAIQGFVTLKFKNTVETLAGLSQIFAIENRFAKFDDHTLSFVWDALESSPNILWAEPDLISEITQATYTPPGELADPRIASVFAKFKASGAYQYATEKGLTAAENRRGIVVAILDTGIDYKHPKLVTQMFKNPREENGTAGVDDDNNGYVDDIFGIDASFDPADGDSLGDPKPGAADLGGPGSSCTAPFVGTERNQCGHGTHVAGIVAAQATGQGVMGVCQECRVYSLRAATRKLVDGVEIDSGISDSAQIRSLAYVLNFTDSNGDLYIHIVNMSIGKYFRSRAIAFLISSLSKNGVLVVAAAGNEGTETPSYPAAFRSVLSVCALSTAKTNDNPAGTGEYAIAPFSNFGQWIDICAPGTAIYSTWPGLSSGDNMGAGGATKPDSGTSMASPVVAGAAGYLWSLSKSLNADSVKSLLLTYANANDVYKNEPNNEPFFGNFKYGNTGYYYLGKGALDLENAVKALNNEGVKNDYLGATEYSPQINQGCIASSVAGVPPQKPLWPLFSSMPFILLLFGFFVRVKRIVLKIKR